MANEVKNFVFLQEWRKRLDKIKDIQKRKDFIYSIVEYGTMNEKISCGDTFGDAWLEGIYSSIDNMKMKYSYREEGGREGGRSISYDEIEMKKLISQKKKAKEIAESLGISVDTVYKSPYWKNRGKNNYYIEEKFGIGEDTKNTNLNTLSAN